MTAEIEKMERIVKDLQEPTPHEHVKFLPKAMNSRDGKRYYAMAIPYVDIAFVRQRLDDACGPFGWKSEAKEVNGLSFCGISIMHPTHLQWVSRWDTGQDDAWHENEKGERPEGEKFSMGARGIFSISFKRAAYQWGVGRDVLAMRVFRCECDTYDDAGGRTRFKGWVENPLVKQVAEMEIRQSLPPATKGSHDKLQPVVEGGSEVSKYQDTGARSIANNCMESGIYTCGMTKEQYEVILNEYEQDGGCRSETYADLYNWLLNYRKAKLEIVKEANLNLADGDRPFEIRDDLHEQVMAVVNLA